MSDLELLTRIERNLRYSAALERERVDLGAFEAFFSSSSDPLLNVALPAARPSDWRPFIERLDAAFAARGLAPRLELFVERYPELPAALEAAGYRLRLEAPVMVLRAGELRRRKAPDGIVLRALEAGDEARVDAFLDAQAEAFGMPLDLSDEGWRPALLSGLAEGSILATVALEEDRVLGGATLLLGGGPAELAGVGTRPAERRRGIARAVCERLLARYFAAGHPLCWLSAGPETGSLYHDLGFRAVGTQRNYDRRD